MLDENVAVVRASYRGSYNATGKPINARMAHVRHDEAGGAASFRQNVETLQVARAVRGA